MTGRRTDRGEARPRSERPINRAGPPPNERSKALQLMLLTQLHPPLVLPLQLPFRLSHAPLVNKSARVLQTHPQISRLNQHRRRSREQVSLLPAASLISGVRNTALFRSEQTEQTLTLFLSLSLLYLSLSLSLSLNQTFPRSPPAASPRESILRRGRTEPCALFSPHLATAALLERTFARRHTARHTAFALRIASHS
jgi:hypothetical protein